MKLYDGYPILTARQVQAVAENMIPERLRPFYIGASILKCDPFQPWTAWNSDVVLYFKYPVVGYLDDWREAHSTLEDLEHDLAEMRLDYDSRTEERAECDEECDGKPIVAIRKPARPITWRRQA